MLAYLHRQLTYTRASNNALFNEIATITPDSPQLNQLAAHISLAQQVWWNRVQQEPILHQAWEDLSIEESISLNHSTLQSWLDYLNQLQESDLKTIISYQNLSGVHQEKSLETILQHLAYHAAYHRGQIALLLRSFSTSIPSTDYIRFTLEV